MEDWLGSWESRDKGEVVWFGLETVTISSLECGIGVGLGKSKISWARQDKTESQGVETERYAKGNVVSCPC